MRNVGGLGGKANPPIVVVFAGNTPNQMINHFDFVFEHQIENNPAVSASYIGSLGRYLPIFVDTNLSPPTGTITYTFVNGPNNGQTITVPLFTARPNPLFGRITTISDSVNSTYNALVLKFDRRMTAGLQLPCFSTIAN